MEESEPEEGEAFSYHGEVENSTIDPEVDLSYIGEKLQNVLGHFQKDFEGGVSAENLGAKFGGYGSFLPTYQRYPSWSHTTETHSHDTPRGPKKMQSEFQRQSLLASSSASPTERHSDASQKTLPDGNSLKGSVHIPCTRFDDSNFKCGVTEKPLNSSDQRMLKVRIKVGSENLSKQKNAEIYGGLGLVISPSSSMDGSPATGERGSDNLLNAPEGSPTSILQIMTSFYAGHLLSPLSEDLVYLNEKRKHKGKTVESNTFVSEGMLIEKPLSGSKTEKKVGIYSGVTEKKLLDCESAQDIDRIGKLGENMGLSNKVEESKSGSHASSFGACTKDDGLKVVKSLATIQSEANVSKGRKHPTVLPSDRSQQFVIQKGGSGSEEGLQSAFQKSSPMQPRNLKGIQNIGGQGLYVQKEKLMIDSSLSPKGGRMSHSSDLISKNDSRDLQENPEIPVDLHLKDFFGIEEDDKESISNDSEMRKDTQRDGKISMCEYPSTSKERGNGNVAEKPQSSQICSRAASQEAAGNGPNSEAPGGLVPTVNDGWVSCNMCKKWRLLPPGKNPKILPENWRCRMLNWLPGMNHCNVPQEETTNALRALYCPADSSPVPDSKSHQDQLRDSIGTSAAISTADAWVTVQESQNNSVVSGTTSEMKHGAEHSEKSTDLDGSPHSLPSKSILPSLGKKKEGDKGNHSPIDARGNQNVRQLNDEFEKQSISKRKESLAGCSDAGSNKKARIELEFDVDGSRTCNRIKKDANLEDEKRSSENGGASLKPGGICPNDLPNSTLGSDRHMHIKRKDPRGNRKNTTNGSNPEIHFTGTSNDDLMHSWQSDKDSDRKRKGEVHRDSHSSLGCDRQNSKDVMEEKLESDQRKKKKTRVSKSEEKDASGSKSRAGSDGKDRSHYEHHNGQYRSNSPAEDCCKSDRGLTQHPVAANSSSSKVSGSLKNKVVVSEGKGSPVESVSSSPLRLHNADKLISAREILVDKDDFQDSYSLNAVSSRRPSGGGDGGLEQVMVKKDAQLIINDNVADIHENHFQEANQPSCEKYSSGKCKIGVKTIPNHVQSTAYNNLKKSENGLSLYSKPKTFTPGSDLDKEEEKVSDSSHDYLDQEYLYKEKSNSRKNKSNDRSGTTSRIEKLICKKDTAEGPSSESSKGCSQMEFRSHDDKVKKSQDKNHNLLQAHESEKLHKKYSAEANGKGAVPSLPPLSRVQTEIVVSQPISSSEKENIVKDLVVDVLENGGASKAFKPSKRTENHTGQLNRDSSSHAANNALKEAKDLKHLADRQKNSGSPESNVLYFQAALKFLHGASLLESGSNEGSKHNDLMHSMHIYSSTAKLCEFCAHEFEKSKDMAAAALAYKCMEVAYMRVVYSSHSSASKDRNKLQSEMHIAPPGESPFSSASDVDNLNQGTGDKSSTTKVVGSPQVSGNPVVTSQNRSGFIRLLNFAQDVNFAMEASRKSRSAFTAATSKLGETDTRSLKKALDFNFQDVDGLLRLVRISMEAINR